MAKTTTKTFHVYSTLTNDVRYTNFMPGGADLPVPRHEVLVKGGAGVANDRIITPLGVRTEVNEKDVEAMRLNKVFQLHEKNGFVVIKESIQDADKVAADMASRDGSAPVVPQDLSDADQPK